MVNARKTECGPYRFGLKLLVRALPCALLAMACAGPLGAQSISITRPAGNEAVSGFSGYYFRVSLRSAPSVVKVCYTVDAYAAYNPGIDAPTTLGCSIVEPFSYPYNSYWNINGPHQLVATAYDALGNVAATSVAVPFTTANAIQTTTLTTFMIVRTSTPVASRWSGAVTVTPTLSGSKIPGDSLQFNTFIDGIHQESTTNATATATLTFYTAQFQNGMHNVCVEVQDLTTYPKYTGGVQNTVMGLGGGAGEWCRTVTFANGAAASQAQLNAHEIYLAPGGTFKLTARILNTDGSTTASANPVFAIADPELGVYMNGLRGADLVNIRSGVARVDRSTGVVTALSNGAALLNVMTPTITLTDLAVNRTFGFNVSSASHPFTLNQNGWLLNITGGGCTRGVYQISLVGGGAAVLGNHGFSTAGPLGTTGCVATLGPTRQVWVYVWPTNTGPCFGQDGSIQASYTPNCMFVNSMFNSLSVLQQDPPYNPGAAADFNASGFNTFEFGVYQSQLTGAESASTFQATLQSTITSAETNGYFPYSLHSYPKFRGLTQGGSLFALPQSLWALTYGNESSPNFIGSQTGLQYLISQYMAQGNVLGDTTVDEISATWGYTVLQGPLTFSANGTTQSALQSITALNGGTCEAALAGSSPPITFIGDQKFIIRGSATAGMNSVAPAVYSAVRPGGAASAAVISGGGKTVTVKITNGGTNYYLAPAVTLIGGGGTYASATASVNSRGAITSVTVSGAAGYVNNPAVVFSTPNFVFACPGVANGAYNASNDPGLTVEPYANAWYANNKDYAHYDVWAKYRAQANAVPNRKFWFSNPPLGLRGPLTFANWTGNPLYPGGGQTINSINSVADAGDLYWPFNWSTYIASRLSAHELLSTLNQGYWFRSLYGAYNPSLPFLELTEATTSYVGQQGYPVSVTSCSGNTITFNGPHRITNIIPGITRLWITGATDTGRPTDSCNNNFTVLAAPTATTLTVLLGATNFASTGSGGTVTWQDGTTTSLASINAAGRPTLGGSAPFYFLDGDLMNVTAWSANNSRKRGQTFTLSGVAGSGAANFNYNAGGHTFLLLPENLNLSKPPIAQYAPALFYREIPELRATGGGAHILLDFNYRKGVNGSSYLTDLNPGWAFGSVMECLLERCAGQRVYKIMRGVNGYSDQLGFTGASADLTGFATTDVTYQYYMNEHFENGHSVPTFHAMSNASLMAVRLANYLLQPALNSPDYGFMMDCSARAGSYGDTLLCLNTSDGPRTVKFSLSPYQKAGQNIIRYVVNDHSISLSIIAAGATTDTLSLDPVDAVFYVFPSSFAGELEQPAIAARLADVPNATKIVVRYAYDIYYLDSAIGSAYDCGAGDCTPPWDRNIGTVYFRLIYLGPNAEVLATSDVQTL